VKGLRIGRRRGRDSDAALSPLEVALRPALVDGRWQVPDHFNFTRDVVETLGRDPKRRALTSLGREGVIEHRNFIDICAGAAVWATTLREASVSPGDRVIVAAPTTVDWLELVLGTLKTGAVVVPCLPDISPSLLERLVSSTDAALVVAEHSLEPTIERMGFAPDVHYYEVGVPRGSKDIPVAATHNTASRDLAFIVSTAGVGGIRKDVAHTHGSVFATRVQAEHWLDVGRGDAVWSTTDAASPLTMWNTVVGPWSRGAEVVLHEGPFDVDERLDLLFRLGPSIICQSPAEYRALAEHRRLERFRSPRLRRLVSTGDYLDPEVVAVFEERWGMTIADGYGQTETNIVVANLADGAAQAGSMGRALPGYHVAIIDDQGNELPAGLEGDLAVRGRPPTLFAGYWELPEETKSAFLGDWYLTGDVAQMDEDGVFTFVGRAEDVITSSGRPFGPFEVERVLTGHPAIAAAAVVGIRDLQRGGQFVRAFVVPRPGAVGSEQAEAELRQYAAEALPGQQVPREIVFVDELPTTSWKVSRNELRERPLAGRPLWDAPPTSDPELEAAQPLPPSIASEFSPRVDPVLETPPPVAPLPVTPAPEPVAFVEPVVASPPPEILAPEVLPPEPVVPAPVAPEPVLTPVEPDPIAFEPAAEAMPVSAPAPAEPVSEAVPIVEPFVEPEPEPEPATLVEYEPFVPPDPEPVAFVEPVAPEPEPAALVEYEPFVPPEPDPEPVALVEPESFVAPEPEPEPVALVEPKSFVAPEPEPVAFVEPVVEPTPMPDAVEPEPVYVIDAEPAAVVAETAKEPDLEPEPLPAVPETQAEPEPAAPEPPALVVLPELATEPEPEPEHTPEFGASAEAALSLPDYVIDEPEGPPPVVIPEPEPEPELSPLPDFVVEPGSTADAPPAPPVAPVLEVEEEEDLGPLPDFVIDPDLPPEERPAPPPKPVPVTPPPPAVLQVPTSEKREPTMSNAASAGIYFPPTTAFPIRRDDDGDDESSTREKRAPRPRPQAELGNAKRSTEPAEPGDEGAEVGCKAGLSNRLSAYSLADEESELEDASSAGDAADETGES
jgi:acyl-coenzyme A synthetase/AMP-(fatty) acid ligase